MSAKKKIAQKKSNENIFLKFVAKISENLNSEL
jgi:hypothetical protein